MLQDLLRVSSQSRIQCRWAELKKGRQIQDQVQRVLLTVALESRRRMPGQSVASNNATIGSVLHKKAKGKGIFLAEDLRWRKELGKEERWVRKGEKIMEERGWRVARVELLVAKGQLEVVGIVAEIIT